MKIICETSKDIAFTEGKAYEIVEGRIIDDDGTPRPLFIRKGDEIKGVEDIRDRKDGNWSWIGKFREDFSRALFN